MNSDGGPIVSGVEGLHQVVSRWPHEGEYAALIHELKYGRATGVVSALADALAAIAPPADRVTWVPCSPSRRRQRGFDQSELLARAVAQRLDVRVGRRLRRVDDTAQTARSLPDRVAGPEFVALGRRSRRAPTIVLIDDVLTTGSTLRRAAAELHRLGAGSVIGLTVTRAGGGQDRAAPASARQAV